MWKAEKIVLSLNSTMDDVGPIYFKDCYTLLINDEPISNTINSNHSPWDGKPFQNLVYSLSKSEFCTSAGYLMLRKHGNQLLILPALNYMEKFEEYDLGVNGDRKCPPHRWFTHGVLVVDEKKLEELYFALPGLASSDIPKITEQEMDWMLQWESLVREKPNGFICLWLDNLLSEFEKDR